MIRVNKNMPLHDRVVFALGRETTFVAILDWVNEMARGDHKDDKFVIGWNGAIAAVYAAISTMREDDQQVELKEEDNA